MNEALLFGLGIPSIVAIIVQIAKALRLATDNSAPWWAFISGIILSYLATLVTQFPQIIPFVQPLIYAIMAYGGATGIYHAIKQVGEHAGLIDKKPEDPAPLPTILPPINPNPSA